MSTLAGSSPCPCGRLNAASRPLRYAQCCGQWLESDAPAADAEALMRSRYSAFVLERGAYLLKTWQTNTRPLEIAFDPQVKWLGLEVRKHCLLDADHSEVEFVARQREHPYQSHK